MYKKLYKLLSICVVLCCLNSMMLLYSSAEVYDISTDAISIEYVGTQNDQVELKINFKKTAGIDFDLLCFYFNLNWDADATVSAENVTATSQTNGVSINPFGIGEVTGDSTARADILAYGEMIPDEFELFVYCDANPSYDKLYFSNITPGNKGSDEANIAALGCDENAGNFIRIDSPIEINLSDSPSSTISSIPTSSITDITNGAATVSGTVTDGKATLNVASEKACVVAYTTDEGKTYTRVNAAQADSGYNFVVPNYSEDMKFVVGLSGDADGDGSVGTSDYTAIARSLLLPENGRYQALSAVNSVFADADGDGSVGTSDYTAIARSLLLESNPRYAAIEWK